MDRAAEDETGEPTSPPKHIDAIIEKNKPSVTESRAVEVSRTEDWGTIGVALFLTPEELEKQGIDPETTDEVVVRVKNGFVLINSK